MLHHKPISPTEFEEVRAVVADLSTARKAAIAAESPEQWSAATKTWERCRAYLIQRHLFVSLELVSGDTYTLRNLPPRQAEAEEAVFQLNQAEEDFRRLPNHPAKERFDRAWGWLMERGITFHRDLAFGCYRLGEHTYEAPQPVAECSPVTT